MTGKNAAGGSMPAPLRRRSGWEATDMGILLWRQNWKSLFLFFGIPLGLCFLTVGFMPAGIKGTGGIVIWWLLPLLDRFALQVVSVRFLDAQAPVRGLFKGLGRTLWRGLMGDLLWRRFSPFRSARMPVTVLENAGGIKLYQRKQLLSRNGLDFGFPLTFICLGLEIVLVLGELVFIFAMGQLFFSWLDPDIISFFAQNDRIITALAWINQLLIEPLYVCMGFGLYINSRVETEGWDIELLFKKIAESEETPVRGFIPGSLKRGALLGLFLFFGTALTFPGTGPEEKIFAELLAPEKTAEPESAALDKVLASPDFGYYEPSWDLRFKRRPEAEGPRESPRAPLPLRDFFGGILRAAMAAALAAALVFSYRTLRRRRFFRPGEEEIFSRVKKDEDPRALLDQAELLYNEGKIREGWARCLRAFMTALIQRGLPLSDETTEYEVLALARRGPAIPAGVLETFMHRWISLAYGGKDPGKEGFEGSVRDCRVLCGGSEGPRQREGTE
ncbi:MAG: DUF4129 domain-containing protein [Spirochaetaceae bacterium]|jgi:hypothetical protein|nr:DUF4129 domain-containing protein [Spirochaetaceae bacterium]